MSLVFRRPKATGSAAVTSGASIRTGTFSAAGTSSCASSDIIPAKTKTSARGTKTRGTYQPSGLACSRVEINIALDAAGQVGTCGF